MIRSIHGRLMLAQATGFAALLAICGWLVHRAMERALLREFDDGVARQSQALMSLIKSEDGHIELELSPRFLSNYEGPESEWVFQIRDETGRTLARSPSLGQADLPARTGRLEQPLMWEKELADDRDFRGVTLLFTTAQDEGEKGPAFRAILSVGADFERVERTVERMDWILLRTGAAMLVVAVLLVAWLVRRGLRPLNLLAAQATKVDVHSLSTRFPTERVAEELEPIYARLNELLARLQEGFERERRFGADLAHEVRTPVAELRTLAEVALRWPEQIQATLPPDLLAIAVRMEGLLTRLLALSRAEQPGLALETTNVDLALLLRQLTEEGRTRAQERGLCLKCELPPRCIVTTDVVLLRAILGNLLGNALAHAPRGAEVSVVLHASEGGFRLEVANPAPGLRPDEVPRLFERFWRADRARTGSEHAGLGLSIARSFARLLGLDLTATLTDAGELKFVLAGK